MNSGYPAREIGLCQGKAPPALYRLVAIPVGCPLNAGIFGTAIEGA
jgi:hypothetical protein